MNEVWEFLKAAQTYYLATVDNGKARARPFGTAEIFEGKPLGRDLCLQGRKLVESIGQAGR